MATVWYLDLETYTEALRALIDSSDAASGLERSEACTGPPCGRDIFSMTNAEWRAVRDGTRLEEPSYCDACTETFEAQRVAQARFNAVKEAFDAEPEARVLVLREGLNVVLHLLKTMQVDADADLEVVLNGALDAQRQLADCVRRMPNSPKYEAARHGRGLNELWLDLDLGPVGLTRTAVSGYEYE